jgi:DoxX-like family
MASDMYSGGDSKKMVWAGCIVSAVPVLLLLFSGSMKLMKSPEVAKGFADLGWPDNLALTLGIVELTCTILYVIPQTAVLGAILLTGYLGGAVATHARLGQGVFLAPVGVGILVWLGLFLRDARLRALIPWRR